MKLFIFTLILTSSLYAGKGRDGNGGNEIALRFTQIAQKSLKYMEDQIELKKARGRNSEFNKINTNLLKQAIEETKIYVVTYKLCNKADDKLCPDEDGFVAKNYPDTNEIYINEKKWKSLSFEEKVRVTLHEYFGLIALEEATYHLSSKVIIALNSPQNSSHYSCQMSLIHESRDLLNGRYKVLGSNSFTFPLGSTGGRRKSAPIQYSKDNVIFSVVMSNNYLRGKVQVAKIDRKNQHFIQVKKVKEVIFENKTFFDGEPIGVKVFKKDDYLLQVSCIHI